MLATGETHTVREFCKCAFERLGFQIDFRGSGVNEVGFDSATGKELIAIDPRYFRATEVAMLVGDASKARKILGWKPRVMFRELVEMMADADLQALQSNEPFVLAPVVE